MLRPLTLLAPALVPSWNFFDSIGPSPRIEYSLAQERDEMPQEWREFRPRPTKVSFKTMLARLFWNQRWNESLYVVSCAERLIDGPAEHRERAILEILRKDLAQTTHAQHWLRFRICCLSRRDDQVERKVAFVSSAKPLHS